MQRYTGPVALEEDPAAPARGTPRLRRSDRREQLLSAAATAFAAKGFTATGIEEVAEAAGVTRAILYRHFDSKTDLYRAALERARQRLAAAVGPPDYDETIVDALLSGAAIDPDGFRLLFAHAAREPQFRSDVDAFHQHMRSVADQQLRPRIPDPAWGEWAARLLPEMTTTAIIAWLDAGQPDPATAATRIRHVLTGVLHAAQEPPRRT